MEDMKSARPSCSAGQVHFSPEGGWISLLEGNVVSPDGFVVSQNDLKKANFKLNAPINYKGNKVGEAYSLFYSTGNNALLLYFKSDIPLEGKEYELIASPILTVKTLDCPLCHRRFERGSSHCECIFNSNITVLGKIMIDGVLIAGVKHDDVPVMSVRDDLLHRHFAGAISTLQYEEPF